MSRPDVADDHPSPRRVRLWAGARPSVEAVRAHYLLDAARRRRDTGAAGLWAWRIGRYLQQRVKGE